MSRVFPQPGSRPTPAPGHGGVFWACANVHPAPLYVPPGRTLAQGAPGPGSAPTAWRVPSCARFLRPGLWVRGSLAGSGSEDAEAEEDAPR